MFYSNEVYLTNFSHARKVEKGYRFTSDSIDDILIDDSRIIDKEFILSTLPTIKSRLFKLVDVLDVEMDDGESTNYIESRPNVVLEGIYNNITLVARVRDILFCSRDAKNRLPTIRGYAKMSTLVTLPWSMESDLISRADSSYYISEEYISRRETSREVSCYTSWAYTNKIWKRGKFVDRLDSRISMPNRFYLDGRVQKVLVLNYEAIKTRNREYNSVSYRRCYYCRKVEYRGMRNVGEISFVCDTCTTEVEIPCGVCLGTEIIGAIKHRNQCREKLKSICKDMGVEFLHSSCTNYMYKECGKCKKIDRADLVYVHSIESLSSRIEKLRELSEDYFDLDGRRYCSSCANLHLNHRLYSPYRSRSLPTVIHIDKVYTRHTGIESEVITNYNDSDEYADCEIIPSQFEVVGDGSLSEGGVEYRTARPLVGSEVCNALSDLEKAHRRHDNWVDESCGIHIHMNAIDFGFREIKNLLMLSSSIQDTIYESLPSDRRENSYARRITMTPTQISEIEDLPTLISKYYNMTGGVYNLGRYNEGRYIGTNLHARFFLGTIEFRYHEGQIYSPPIRSWIKFLNRLMDTSKDLHRNKKLYQQVLSSTSNAMDIIDSIGGRESTEYIEKRININK